MDPDMFLALHKTLACPHMEYVIQTWSAFLLKDIDSLGKVQRRATKLVPVLRGHLYKEGLEALDVTTLEARRVGSSTYLKPISFCMAVKMWTIPISSNLPPEMIT